MIWLESLIILACIMIGARKNGVAMGFAGGVGLCLLVFIFGLRPSSPPVNVLLIITAVSAMAATLQCAGGLDLLVAVAEKILRSHPDRITIMAPIVTFVFTMFTGTSYVAMAVYPVISEVALEANIRVERPMSIAMLQASTVFLPLLFQLRQLLCWGFWLFMASHLGRLWPLLFPPFLLDACWVL